MKDYPAWKNSEKKRNWRTTVAIFIAVFLMLASIKGFVKFGLASKNVAKSNWDSISSFVVGIGDHASSLFIFQKDPKRAVILTLGKNGLRDIGDEQAIKQLSVSFGAPVENYIKFKNDSLEKVSDIKKYYENFTSWLTPVSILMTGWHGNNLDTNISRIDAIRLWWQIKSIGVNNVKFDDLSNLGQTNFENNNKVLAANTSDLNREISKYLENSKIVKDDLQINIVNSSSQYATSILASNFIYSVGGRVGTISGNIEEISRCNIVGASSSYTLKYLAKLFDCDIKEPSQTASEGQITLILGNEFAKKYF